MGYSLNRIITDAVCLFSYSVYFLLPEEVHAFLFIIIRTYITENKKIENEFLKNLKIRNFENV